MLFRRFLIFIGCLINCLSVSNSFAYWPGDDPIVSEEQKVFTEMLKTAKERFCKTKSSTDCQLFKKFETAKTPKLPDGPFFTFALTQVLSDKVKGNGFLTFISNPKIELEKTQTNFKTTPANCILLAPQDDTDWKDTNNYLAELKKGHRNETSSIHKRMQSMLATKDFVHSLYIENSIFVYNAPRCIVRQKEQQLYVLYMGDGIQLVTMPIDFESKAIAK